MERKVLEKADSINSIFLSCSQVIFIHGHKAFSINASQALKSNHSFSLNILRWLPYLRVFKSEVKPLIRETHHRNPKERKYVNPC
jgi:hypothetical protein